MSPAGEHRRIDPDAVGARARYELLTSLVLPRPIAWISSFGADGTANLAPFSYFAALSSSPMQVGVSIGQRNGEPKDTLANLRARGEFCVNVVSEPFLDAMNASSANVPPDADEFQLVGLTAGRSDVVDAPLVEDCPAVLECRVVQEVSLGEAPNTLVIGRVVGVRLHSSLTLVDDSWAVTPEDLRPVARLAGAGYALFGPTRFIARPG